MEILFDVSFRVFLWVTISISLLLFLFSCHSDAFSGVDPWEGDGGFFVFNLDFMINSVTFLVLLPPQLLPSLERMFSHIMSLYIIYEYDTTPFFLLLLIHFFHCDSLFG